MLIYVGRKSKTTAGLLIFKAKLNNSTEGSSLLSVEEPSTTTLTKLNIMC